MGLWRTQWSAGRGGTMMVPLEAFERYVAVGVGYIAW